MQHRFRIVLAFLLAPLAPCLGLGVVFSGFVLPWAPFVALVPLTISYAAILFAAAPLYLWMARRRQATLNDCLRFGFLIGAGVVVLPGLASLLASPFSPDMSLPGGLISLIGSLVMIPASGAVGASIGWCFWHIAFSPRLAAFARGGGFRLLAGFALSPLPPCLLDALFEMVRGSDIDPLLCLIVFVAETCVCYGVILFVAAPLYFLLRGRFAPTVFACSLSGLGIGACGAAILQLLHFGGPQAIRCLMLGTSTGFLFWLIALSPALAGCRMRHDG